MGMSFNTGNPGGPYQARPDLGPGVGFGAGLPGSDFQEGGQQVGQILGGAVDSILGATPIGGAFNQALGGQSFGNVIGQGVGSVLGGAFGGNQPAASMLPQTGGPDPIPGMPNSGMGGGKSGMPGQASQPGQILGGGLNSAFGGTGVMPMVNTALQGAGTLLGGALNQFGLPIGGGQPQGPYTARPDLGPGVGFGVGLPQPTGGVYGRDLSASPNTTPIMGGMGNMATASSQPAPFTGTPRAPVRPAPRTVTPQPITRTRAPRTR